MIARISGPAPIRVSAALHVLGARTISHTQTVESVRQAFTGIAATTVPTKVEDIRSFRAVLCAATDDMKTSGMSLERVVAQIKGLATEAGIRESHDRLITEAVIWCVERYCC